MADYQIIKRLETLVHLLKNYPNRTKQELIHRLENDYELQITTRTLERDFNALETNFGIEVKYNRAEKGYSINEQDDRQVINFLQFVGRIYIGDLLREGLKEFDDLKRYIKLEDYSDFNGIRWIKPLLSAIKNNLRVKFKHENYLKDTEKDYSLTPLQLREYHGRWYLIGIPEKEKHIKTFGLDRISNLKMQGLSTINVNPYKKELEKFERIIGLNYDAAEGKEIIELAIIPSQYKYLKALPLHQSQSFEEELSDGRMKISLYLIPNYELKMELLKLGDQIEVLQPPDLREEIEEILQQTLKQYQHD